MIEVKVTASDPTSAALEILGLVEAMRGGIRTTEPAPEPAPETAPEPEAKTEEKAEPKPNPARKPRKTKTTKAERKAEETGAQDVKDAAEGVPANAAKAELTLDDIKARVVELQRKMGPDARSWFRGAFQVAKISDLDPADYAAVARAIDQRLATLEEEEG